MRSFFKSLIFLVLSSMLIACMKKPLNIAENHIVPGFLQLSCYSKEMKACANIIVSADEMKNPSAICKRVDREHERFQYIGQSCETVVLDPSMTCDGHGIKVYFYNKQSSESLCQNIESTTQRKFAVFHDSDLSETGYDISLMRSASHPDFLKLIGQRLLELSEHTPDNSTEKREINSF